MAVHVREKIRERLEASVGGRVPLSDLYQAAWGDPTATRMQMYCLRVHICELRPILFAEKNLKVRPIRGFGYEVIPITQVA